MEPTDRPTSQARLDNLARLNADDNERYDLPLLPGIDMVDPDSGTQIHRRYADGRFQGVCDQCDWIGVPRDTLKDAATLLRGHRHGEHKEQS